MLIDEGIGAAVASL